MKKRYSIIEGRIYDTATDLFLTGADWVIPGKNWPLQATLDTLNDYEDKVVQQKEHQRKGKI